MTRKVQFDWLTILRGIAAWWVVAYHVRQFLHIRVGSFWDAPLSSGFLAVDLFFVLSGFVIAYTYGKNFEHLRWNIFKVYLMKRFARVYPLHLFLLVCYLGLPVAYALFGKTLPDDGKYDLVYYVASIFLLQNWGWFDSMAWNVPAWSISVEFAAYLMFPVFFLVVRRLNRAVWVVVLVCMCAGGIGWYCQFSGMPSIGHDIPGNGLWRCLVLFFMGVLAHRMYQLVPLNVFVRWGLFAAFLGLMCVYYFGGIEDYWVVPTGFFLLVLSLLSEKSVGAKGRIGIFLGEISYSVYLSHYFIRDIYKLVLPKEWFVQLYWVPCYIITVFFVSWALYRWVELPMRTKIKRMIPREA